MTARPDDGRLRRWRAWLVWAVFGLDLALVIGVGLAAGPWPDTPAFVPALFAAMVASLGGVGALVATRKPRDPVGWILLVSASMVTLSVAGEDYVRLSVTVFGGALPLTVATAWLESLAFGPAIILLAGVMPLYFPDGRLPSRRWRWVVWIAAFGIVVGSCSRRSPRAHSGTPRLTIHSGSRASTTSMGCSLSRMSCWWSWSCRWRSPRPSSSTGEDPP